MLISDLGITGAQLLTPGDPLKSIISVRAHALDINRMPPLGTAVVDTDGTGVIDAWISQADVCVVYPDTDADLVPDNVDNCRDVPNRNQRDSDGDGYGNACDADLNNDGSTNSLDLNLYKQAHRTNVGNPNYNADADFNGDGYVDAGDMTILKSLYRKSPGPSCCAP
jgi:hypothetical protein